MNGNVKAFVACAILLFLLIAVPPLHALWVSDGTPVIIADRDQEDPAIVTDGELGAIIVWEEDRTMDNDLYAQRINERGAPLWEENGVIISDESGFQISPEMTSDGAGGAIVTWTDLRDGNRDIYAQRVDADGAMLWTSDGSAVCNADENQENQQIIPDGSGGAIIVWQDFRNDSHFDIYAQRVSSGGSMLWTSNGVSVCYEDNYQDTPRIVSDGAGGAIIAWSDYRNNNRDVYAQRVDASGTILWAAAGVAICTESDTQWLRSMVSDGAGGAIIVWYDQRDITVIIYAQRVNSNGAVQWTSDGVPLCTITSPQYSPSAAPDGAGGAIIAWEQESSNRNIHAQRISANGSLLWTSNGVDVCSEAYLQSEVQVLPDGEGGAVLVWRDARNGNADYYAQRLDADGVPLWTAGGVPVCTQPNLQDDIAFIYDAAGGAIFTWADYRTENDYDIYASLIDENGDPVATLLQAYYISCSGGEMIITWRLSSQVDVEDFTVSRREAAEGQAWHVIPVEIGYAIDTYSFVDGTCLPGSAYLYRVELAEGGEQLLLFETEPLEMPSLSMTLDQNYPNPFNPSTMIRYYLPVKSTVTINVFDNTGRLVSTLVNGETKPTGYHEAFWNGTNDKGNPVASGVYFYRLEAGKLSLARRMILLR